MDMPEIVRPGVAVRFLGVSVMSFRRYVPGKKKAKLPFPRQPGHLVED
jgi:hypothetical protein